MTSKTGQALLGAAVGAATLGGFSVLLQFRWITLVAIAGITMLAYVVAAVAAKPLKRTTAIGEAMRGFLVGLNSAANFVIAFALAENLAGTVVGLIVGATLGTLNLLTAIGPLSRRQIFKNIIGYVNWLMPMSWPIMAVGLLFSLLSSLLYAVTAGKLPFLRVQAMRIDRRTGTVFIKGGLVANLNYLKTAFNMGNFAFVHREARDWHFDHEIGHTLNLSTFGFLFHLLGALDENMTSRGERAFAERLAESNCANTERPVVPMWI